MNKISSGLLLLLGAGALGVFWVNGYLAKWTGEISSVVGGTANKTPLGIPTTLAATTARGAIAPVPAVPLFGGIA